jgi:nitroreductase
VDIRGVITLILVEEVNSGNGDIEEWEKHHENVILFKAESTPEQRSASAVSIGRPQEGRPA